MTSLSLSMLSKLLGRDETGITGKDQVLDGSVRPETDGSLAEV